MKKLIFGMLLLVGCGAGSGLKIGDCVGTNAGALGIIVEVHDDYVAVETNDGNGILVTINWVYKAPQTWCKQ